MSSSVLADNIADNVTDTITDNATDTITDNVAEDFKAVIVVGKQGRASLTKSPHEMLETYATLETGDSDEDYNEIAEKVISRARDMHITSNNRFDTEYLEANNGAYGINVVTLDAHGTVTGYVAPAYRPTSAGGHVFLKSGDAVYDLAHRLYPELTKDAANTSEIYCVLAKMRDMNVILAVPDGYMSANLANKLCLALKGDGTNTAMLLRTRLCDRGGLARSVAHFSTPKWRFLFPGAPIDLSQKRPKRPRTAAAVTTVEIVKRSKSNAPSDTLFDTLCAAVVRSWGTSSGETGRAVDILETCALTLGTDLFKTIFEKFACDDEEAFPAVLTNEDGMRELVADHVDANTCEKLLCAVRA
jgi:hypothetical protein